MGRDEVPSLKVFMEGLIERNPGQPEFHQAVHEVAEDLLPFIAANERFHRHQILERLSEPDRVISFRVCWTDDENNVRVNRGYRVQHNNAIGPYKGGLRFHPSVNQGVLKFLAFEQTFKNALTGLAMGGAKGGANLHAHGKSDGEIMRFCQAFMAELYRHIGEDVDVPAGDIGVGGREIGYMFGQFKRLTNRFVGVLTGKGIEFGGSAIRPEATGWGAVHFMEEMLGRTERGLQGMTCLVSGSGNVAQFCVERLIQEGAKPLTMSDSDGFIHDPDGIDSDKLDFIKTLKNKQRGRISEYADKFKSASFHADKTPWGIKADLAFPCATQNELTDDDAKILLDHGLVGLAEGANMPCTADAVTRFRKAGLPFGPAKAANAGGVAISGLEMAQNAARISWDREEVSQRLRRIMHEIHARCVQYGENDEGKIDYVRGANVAGFVKVADAMIAQGVV